MPGQNATAALPMPAGPTPLPTPLPPDATVQHTGNSPAVVVSALLGLVCALYVVFLGATLTKK